MLELLTAISLSAMVVLTIFDIYVSVSHLSQQSNQLADLQDRLRLMTVILRQKIQAAGNWSCTTNKPNDGSVIQVLDVNEAQNKWHVHIKLNTEAIELKECERVHDRQRYVPILFFVADTKRLNSVNQNIFSLYYKVDTLPSEEWITDVNEFHVVTTSTGVRIDYLLATSDTFFQYPKRYYFEGQWIMPNDNRLYQPGLLYAVRRI